MFYTYLWLREDGTPYYVGKGKGYRAYTSHKGHRPPKDRSRIVLQYWLDEGTALAYERYLIDFWGRKDLGTGVLRNHTDGGEIPPSAKGIKRSESFCRQISDRKKGKRLSEETRKAATAATIRRFSEGWKFPPKTPVQVEKTAAQKRGIPLSKKHREALSKAQQKRVGRGQYSKTKGVSWYNGRNPEVNGRWTAQVFVEGKKIWLGYFLTEESASTAVMVAREKHGLPPLP